MIDFNKLDDYKVAIDDGFKSEETDKNVRIQVYKDGFYMFVVHTHSFGFGFRIKKVEEKDWETFKKKVADYFLGADKNEN